jgi:hypothetical protein
MVSNKTFSLEAGIGCGIMPNPCMQKKKKKYARQVVLLFRVRVGSPIHNLLYL